MWQLRGALGHRTRQVWARFDLTRRSKAGRAEAQKKAKSTKNDVIWPKKTGKPVFRADGGLGNCISSIDRLGGLQGALADGAQQAWARWPQRAQT